MQQIFVDPAVVAIGETGLDALRGAPLDIQEEIFRQHIKASEELGKPLIIHLVKAYDRLMSIRKEMRPAIPWIIHGFRGKPQLVGQLSSAGASNQIYFSIGERFNAESIAVIPSDRLLIETDESAKAISEILHSVAIARFEDPKKLSDCVNNNFKRLFIEKKFS